MQPADAIPSPAVAVAVCATLSLLACLSLFAYIGWYRFVAREDEKLRFMRNQFGLLFVNLLLSDSIQALGFASNFNWARLGTIDASSVFCTFQAVCIQVGDTASALWILAIAAHTAGVLTTGRKPPRAVLAVVAAAIWLIVILFAVIGPTAIATKRRGPYFTQAGAWCWVGIQYGAGRIWLHYLWLFIAAGGSILFYGWTIFSLRRQARAGLSDKDTWSGSLRSGQTSSQTSQPKRRPSISDPQLAARARVQSAAKKMAFYPLVYTSLVLPLTTYRLLQLTGHEPPVAAQIAVGAVFTLSGLANTLLWGFTRGLFSRKESRRPTSHYHVRDDQLHGDTHLPSYLFSRETDVRVDVDADGFPRVPSRVLHLRTQYDEEKLARQGADALGGSPVSPRTPLSPFGSTYRLPGFHDSDGKEMRSKDVGHGRWDSWP